MPDDPCTQCGKVHKAKQGGRPCTGHCSGWWDDNGERHQYKADDWKPPCEASAMHGQDVCQMHGGRSRQAKARAEIRVREMEAAKTLAQYLVEGDDRDPALILLERMSEASAHVRFYRQQMLTLDEKEKFWGRTKDVVGGKDNGTTYEAKNHVWVAEFKYWDARLHTLCVDALKVGLKQRELDIAQQQGDKILALIEGVLRDAGLDPYAPENVEIVTRNLRVIEGGAA